MSLAASATVRVRLPRPNGLDLAAASPPRSCDCDDASVPRVPPGLSFTGVESFAEGALAPSGAGELLRVILLPSATAGGLCDLPDAPPGGRAAIRPAGFLWGAL